MKIESTSTEAPMLGQVKKAAGKKLPWETAADFSALVAELFPRLIARAAPTAPLLGNSPKPSFPGSIEEAIVALTNQPVAMPAPVPVTEAATESEAATGGETATETATDDRGGKISLEGLEPVDEEQLPEIPLPARVHMSAPQPVIATVTADIPAPLPLPLIDLPAQRQPAITIPIAVAPPPPISEVAPLDFDEDFLPVRDGHIGRASASITVGDGAERVNLRITADSQDVKVHAVTATPEVAREFQRNAPELAASLAKHGLNLSNLSADAGGQRSSGTDHPENNNQHETADDEDHETSHVVAAGVRAVI
jgi:hypothetical protein